MLKHLRNKQLSAVSASDPALKHFSEEALEGVRHFHHSLPHYRPTSLVALSTLAHECNIAALHVKDESERFGLNAFKVLGASYAVARVIARIAGLDEQRISFDRLKELQSSVPRLTFTTATDGNHGRAVAWAARQLGHHAVVYLPKGSALPRVEAIRATGAEGYVTDLNYDDTVRLAARQADEHGWYVIQDTAWKEYEEVPLWIMQGYTTIIAEALEQHAALPTHVFLQAGVGSFAGAILGYLARRYGDDRPRTAIVEPTNAACLYLSAEQADGRPHAVTGDLQTIMAGLSCGEPNPIAWEIIRRYANHFVQCDDDYAEAGMRLLARPLGNDRAIVSGESGAVGAGLLHGIRTRTDVRQAFELSPSSRVLLISTEGATDPKNYLRIVG